MSASTVTLRIILIFFTLVINRVCALDDELLFTVTRAPRYFGVLQDHRQQPMSVELAEDYTDQDYFASNKKHHNTFWNKNQLDADDVEDDESDEIPEEKDADIKLSAKLNMRAPELVV